MKWLLRGAGLTLLLILAAGYVVLGCLALIGDAIGWAMNSTDRLMDTLSKWGEAL